MEYIQSTEPSTEWVSYADRKAPLEVLELPYAGAKNIHLAPSEWMIDLFEFSFSYCLGTEAHKGVRKAFEIEKKDSSQMFFYGVVPNQAAPFAADQKDPAIAIREMMVPVTAACGIYFDQGSTPLVNGCSIETHGECDHATLGHGTWKGEIQAGKDCHHVVVSISFYGLNNDSFFDQVQSEYLYTGSN